MDQSDQEQQQFEQVLSRLDALMKRGHVGPVVVPPVIQPPAESSVEIEDEASTQVADQPAEIPVLTEIYEPAADAIPVLQAAFKEDADIEQAFLDRWLPALRKAMDEIVEEETRRFSDGLQQRLHRQVAESLRQHIRALKNQTEM